MSAPRSRSAVIAAATVALMSSVSLSALAQAQDAPRTIASNGSILIDGRTFTVLDFPNVQGQLPGTFLNDIDNAGRIIGYYGDDLDREDKAGIHGFMAAPLSGAPSRS